MKFQLACLAAVAILLNSCAHTPRDRVIASSNVEFNGNIVADLVWDEKMDLDGIRQSYSIEAIDYGCDLARKKARYHDRELRNDPEMMKEVGFKFGVINQRCYQLQQPKPESRS